MNKCIECALYHPSPKLAGGRCPHTGNESRFKDDTCVRKIKNPEGVMIYAFEAKPVDKAVDKPAGKPLSLGEDPQITYS